MREIWLIVALFAPLSLMSFGGGASILAPMHDTTVSTYHWLSQREFIDFFAIARASPGPGSMVVTLVGWHVAGWTGAIAATLAMFVPSSFLCYGIAKLWNRMRGSNLHAALQQGLLPIGTGLSIAGAMTVLRTSDTGALGILVAVAATLLVSWRDVYPLIVLAAGGSLFLLLTPLFG